MTTAATLLITSLIIASARVSAQEPMVVERGRAGAVVIGAEAETVYQKFGNRARLVDLKLEGHLTPALEIRLFGAQAGASLIAEIWPANGRLLVSRITVLDPRLRTKEGIGVGSTYGELQSRYTVDWVGSGEGGFFARVEALGISFSLDVSAAPDARTARDPARVPPDVRIIGLLLTR